MNVIVGSKHIEYKREIAIKTLDLIEVDKENVFNSISNGIDNLIEDISEYRVICFHCEKPIINPVYSFEKLKGPHFHKECIYNLVLNVYYFRGEKIN